MQNERIFQSLYRVDQVRQIDRAAIEIGELTGTTLMSRAAAAAFNCLRHRWPDARSVLVIAGSGNNGGDAFLFAKLAAASGMTVHVLALGSESHGDAKLARAEWIESGGDIEIASDELSLVEADVLVDGLFGTGLTRAVSGIAAALIEAMNSHRGRKLALDVPSGVDADHGRILGVALRADVTISFVAWKRGLLTADGVDCCGILQLDTLEIPPSIFAEFPADVSLLSRKTLSLLAPRSGNSNKGQFGHVLAIGGEEGMAGAICLAAEASLRVGAGKVSVATRAAHVSVINVRCPELMARGVDSPQSLQAMLDSCGVVVVGPGLGLGGWGHALWDTALRVDKPCVVDADGLNLLAREQRPLPRETILTPHPGEAARLLGCDVASIQADRFAAVREIAKRYAAVVVLKGAGSLIADAHGRLALCPFGNPGMASAGMGDVLSGVLGGLLGQGLSAWDAACMGVVMHGLAGDHAARKCPRGLLASDLFPALRHLVNGHHP